MTSDQEIRCALEQEHSRLVASVKLPTASSLVNRGTVRRRYIILVSTAVTAILVMIAFSIAHPKDPLASDSETAQDHMRISRFDTTAGPRSQAITSPDEPLRTGATSTSPGSLDTHSLNLPPVDQRLFVAPLGLPAEGGFSWQRAMGTDTEALEQLTPCPAKPFDSMAEFEQLATRRYALGEPGQRSLALGQVTITIATLRHPNHGTNIIDRHAEDVRTCGSRDVGGGSGETLNYVLLGHQPMGLTYAEVATQYRNSLVSSYSHIEVLGNILVLIRYVNGELIQYAPDLSSLAPYIQAQRAAACSILDMPCPNNSPGEG